MPDVSAARQRVESDPVVDYTGAIYGSLLAASTVVGTAAGGAATTNPASLLAALLVTSTVFWLLHVYVRVVGREVPRHRRWLEGTRKAAGHELPILLAVVPPTLAVLITVALNSPDARVSWSALWAAIAGQMFWTWLAVRQAQERRSLALLSLAVSLFLGLVLVVLKSALTA